MPRKISWKWPWKVDNIGRTETDKMALNKVLLEEVTFIKSLTLWLGPVARCGDSKDRWCRQKHLVGGDVDQSTS